MYSVRFRNPEAGSPADDLQRPRLPDFLSVKKKCLTLFLFCRIVALMEKIYTQSLLYDFYGELLTEHQRRVYEEVVFDDLSLGEVAEELGISRQGVHDMVRRTEKALDKYEEKLGLVRKFLSLKDKVNEIRELTEDKKIRKLAEEILEEF